MALTRLEGDANDLLAWLVANSSMHPGPWEVAALHAEVPSFSTEQINDAVALLEKRGLVSATRYLGAAPYDVGMIDLTIEGKIEGERLKTEGEASRRQQPVKPGTDGAPAGHGNVERDAGSATSVPALATIELTVAEQRVLDVVADFELGGHEPTLMEHVRLHVAPDVAADPAAIALAMVTKDLLETDVWKKKVYLTPKGLLLSRHGATAERLALALRAYLIARINQEGVGFSASNGRSFSRRALRPQKSSSPRSGSSTSSSFTARGAGPRWERARRNRPPTGRRPRKWRGSATSRT